MNKKNYPKSKCCNADYTVHDNWSSTHDRDDDRWWYSCVKCGKECEVTRTPRIPDSNAQKRRDKYKLLGQQGLFEERFIRRALKAGFDEKQARFLLDEHENPLH